jgi:hypothetical protein
VYVRDSYHDEFIDFPPRSYSHVLPRFYSRASSRTCVEVTLVSMFHPFWCPVAQESKLRRKFLGRTDISSSITGYIRRNRTYPVQGRTCPPESFSSNVCLLFWSYLANRVSNLSYSFFAAFITLRGSFICCWLVCSSLSYRVLTLGFVLRI